VGIGVTGIDKRTRLRVGVIFGSRARDRGELVGGIVMIGVGIAIAAG
jgi:putative Mn2+ efflux pump MntP